MPGKYMVATANSFIKSQFKQQSAKALEWDIRIGSAVQNLPKDLLDFLDQAALSLLAGAMTPVVGELGAAL